MTAAGDALRRTVREQAAKRAAFAAVAMEARLRAAAPQTKEWVHDEPPNPFPPHLALDTYAYEADDDPGLSSAGWPARYAAVGPFFYPQDHALCRCYASPVPRTSSVRLTSITETTITYTADTTLAGVRNPPRVGNVGLGGQSHTFGPGQAASDTAQDDPATRSRWFRDTVALWPQLLR